MPAIIPFIGFIQASPITSFVTSGIFANWLYEQRTDDSSLSRCSTTRLQIERMRTEYEVMGGLGYRDSLSFYKIS